MNTIVNDFIAFEGATLEEAYKKASLEFNCSITNLKSDIIQAPSNGFLGLFKKNAIIKVYKCKENYVGNEVKDRKANIKKETIHIKDISNKIEQIDQEDQIERSCEKKQVLKNEEKIFDTFYTKEEVGLEKPLFIKNDKILLEIKEEIDRLFSLLCYEIDPVKVSYYDNKTLFIEFTGKDSALLIGKEGYRYKALSYILFNWIHEKYDLMIRLEIAEFLSSQEESIHRYLEPVIEAIKIDGLYKTKNLDGILIHIALTRLRAEFPEKYIAVKSNIKGGKYILVNEYRK